MLWYSFYSLGNPKGHSAVGGLYVHYRVTYLSTIGAIFHTRRMSMLLAHLTQTVIAYLHTFVKFSQQTYFHLNLLPVILFTSNSSRTILIYFINSVPKLRFMVYCFVILHAGFQRVGKRTAPHSVRFSRLNYMATLPIAAQISCNPFLVSATNRCILWSRGQT